MPFQALFRRAAILLIVVFFAQQAQADVVTYRFTLTVDAARIVPGKCGLSVRNGLGGFDCDTEAGDMFEGQFQVAEDTSGLVDGIYSFLPLASWSIRIGADLWDMNAPYPGSQFFGFRDGSYCGTTGNGLGGENPGLIVSSGVVSGFCGGVFGLADDPFIDFDYIAGPGRFSAFDGNNGLSGEYVIERVPEPSSVYLIVVSISLLLAVRRRQMRAPTM
ncbi:MAG: PEP-CTERM sorting domain-containing protein [Rubrivivax sp.]